MWNDNQAWHPVFGKKSQNAKVHQFKSKKFNSIKKLNAY